LHRPPGRLPGAPLTPRLRPATDADRNFLLAVYASTRAEELAMVPWDDATKLAFATHQFDAQDAHYRQHYPTATFDVIEVDGEPVGRLYVDRWEREIRIVDISLLPAFRGRGIGGGLLRQLIDEAALVSKRLSVHVERANPARTLYDRLGFVPIGEHGVYVLMEWTPS
jgi:GNAT superfamily N-acetyltransferase